VTRDLKRFAFDIREIAEMQPLPEYGVQVERKGRRELVTLYRDPSKPCRPPRGRRLKTIRGEHVEPSVKIEDYLDALDDDPPLVIEPTPEPAAVQPFVRLVARYRDILAAIANLPRLDTRAVSAQKADAQRSGLLRLGTAAKRLAQELEPLCAGAEFEDTSDVAREESDEWRQWVQQVYEKTGVLEHSLDKPHRHIATSQANAPDSPSRV
jgi:hypothetical protein